MFREAIGVELPAPFPVLTYDEAMRDYGTDKPDLRIPLKLAEITDAVKDVEFKVFSAPANAPGGRVCALRVPGGGALTRGELDDYSEYAKTLGAKGLAWIKVNQRAKGAEGLQSPIVKNLHARALATILERTAPKTATSSSSAPTRRTTVDAYMGALREKVGHDRGSPRKPGARSGWSTSRCSSSTRTSRQWNARHHPFTSPKDGHEQYIETIRRRLTPRPTTWC